MKIGIGIGMEPIFISPAGGGEEGYVAPAIHVDGTAWLEIASLTATDNEYVSFAYWQKAPDDGALLYFSNTADGFAYFDVSASPGSGQYRKADFGLTGPGDPFPGLLHLLGTDDSILPNVWQCIIGSANTQTGEAKLYNGDTDISGNLTFDGAFNNAFNGFDLFVLGAYGQGAEGDFSDVRIMPGINLLTAGDIPEATRRLFIDASGKPVDPAVATAALGAPRVLFSGDASTFGTNQGTGGAFTQTGTFTNASTSPSD